MAKPDISWVTGRLAVGGAIGSLYEVRKLAAMGVTRVLNLRAGDNKPEHVTDEAPWWAEAGVVYATNPTHDDGDKKDPDWFAVGISFAIEGLEMPGCKMLIHCAEGISRSPSMMYAVLMALGIEAKLAAKMVTDARPEADLKYAKDAERAVKKLGYV